MKLMEPILDRGRLILTIAAMLALAGALQWAVMVRQEDPTLPDYWGQVTASFPGLDALNMERLILDPIEDALAEVDEIKTVEATAYDGIVVLQVELLGSTGDFDHAWDEVRRALAKARKDFPSGAGAPVLNDDLNDQDSVVLAVTGSTDLLKLRDAALKLKDRLLRLHYVSKVSLIADPEEQVTVELDDSTAKRLNLSPVMLADQLAARNRIIPGGSIEQGGKTVRLRPRSEFKSVAEIALTPINLASGASVMLKEVAAVRHGVKEPVSAKMRFNGEIAVGLAVVPKRDINLVAFGDEVRELIRSTAADIAPLHVREVTFQPGHTAIRLSGLTKSLLSAMLIVAGVLILAMGVRLGLVVTLVVPLVTLTSLALFAWGGGVLQQISIAAFVLALGMLVDNAIVVAENVQYRMDTGQTPRGAAIGAVRELAVPLAGATATTLAAFVPMLISQGPTAVFTRSIPVVIMLCLSISYVYALLVTPVLSRMALNKSGATRESWLVALGYRMAELALKYSKSTVGIALVLLVLIGLLSSRIERQFFPAADRNQFVIGLKLAEGSHLSSTDSATRQLEEALLKNDKVVRAASFMGRGAPVFYYNIARVPFSPHFAQLIVETRSMADVESVLAYVSDFADRKLPGIEVISRKLEQGPPVDAPVEVRLYSPELQDLSSAAASVCGLLTDVKGARNVRHDMSPGAPTVRFYIDDAAAARQGLTRSDLSRTLYGRTRGLSVGELYMGDDPVPILVRSSSGEKFPARMLGSVEVASAKGGLVPMSQLTRQETAWTPASIKHRNGRRLVTVSSQLTEGAVFSQVLKAFQPRLRELELPRSVEVSYGGDLEGSGEANTALMASLPIGILLLFSVLLAEFNSFRRVGLVLMTVPLAAAGIVPGLLLNHQPFGFMSLLGVFALVGIVVNNAIVLLEVVEARRKEGADVNTAVRDAVGRRIRPILLTTATTVAGLLPLASNSSTLWPPLASAMISGLLASTMLTLMLLPATYRLLFNRGNLRGHGEESAS